MTDWDAEDRADIDGLPLRIRWRYRLRPAWLRVAINRVWHGRWSQQEIDDIMRRARARSQAMQRWVE